MTRLKRWVWSLIRTSKIIKEETMCEGAYNYVSMTTNLRYISLYYHYHNTCQYTLTI